MQVYSDKLVALAEDAFLGKDIRSDYIDRLLMCFIFFNGLQHNSLQTSASERRDFRRRYRISVERRKPNEKVPFADR